MWIYSILKFLFMNLQYTFNERNSVPHTSKHRLFLTLSSIAKLFIPYKCPTHNIHRLITSILPETWAERICCRIILIMTTRLFVFFLQPKMHEETGTRFVRIGATTLFHQFILESLRFYQVVADIDSTLADPLSGLCTRVTKEENWFAIDLLVTSAVAMPYAKRKE